MTYIKHLRDTLVRGLVLGVVSLLPLSVSATGFGSAIEADSWVANPQNLYFNPSSSSQQANPALAARLYASSPRHQADQASSSINNHPAYNRGWYELPPADDWPSSQPTDTLILGSTYGGTYGKEAPRYGGKQSPQSLYPIYGKYVPIFGNQQATDDQAKQRAERQARRESRYLREDGTPKDNTDNRYRVGGIIGTGLIWNGLQDNFRRQSSRNRVESMTSFTFDWFLGRTRNHGLVLEYHQTADFVLSTGSAAVTEQAGTIYVGYRYHTRPGFYVGVGMGLYTQGGVSTEMEGVPGRRSSRTSYRRYLFNGVPPFGANLGYVYTFRNGFSIGTNFIYTTATRVDRRDGTPAVRNGYAIRSWGLVLAYTHRS